MEETVNIQLLAYTLMWRRRNESPANWRNSWLKGVEVDHVGKSAWDSNLKVPRGLAWAEMDVSRLPRKSAKDMCMAPVPQTDTRGHVKSTKALERFTAKELGKITP